ncbi:MAG: response regulator [Clostridiaceae bacterium]|nr:response regulator [Clostridiaceae bacterium]
MYKMIIADDEPSTRQGIRTAINWSLLDIEIVAEAANGTETLDLVRTLDPDILICDIRMPKMDGMTLAGILRHEKPALQILFLSGYSDKEYLKTAIRLSAVDYLYKPFEIDELVAAIKKAKTQLSSRVGLPKPIPNNDLALQLLDSRSAQTLAQAGHLPLDTQGPFVTLVIRIKSGDGLLQESGSQHQELLDLTLMAHHYADSLHKAAALTWGSAFVLSLVGNGFVLHANRLPGRRSQDGLSRLQGLLQAFGPVSDRVVIGVSNQADRITDIKRAFTEARKAAQAAFLTGYGQIIPFSAVSSQPFVPRLEFAEPFGLALEQGRAAEATGLLKDYLRYMKSCTPDHIPQIKDALAQIAMQINSRLSRRTGGQACYVADMILTSADINDIGQYILDMAERYQDEASRLSSTGRIVFDAERFILDHIEDKDLSIRKIAEHVYVTPTYLSYIYKKKTGSTINHFILDTRMKRARDLILETNLQLGEISSRLGYANQNYFTKTFTRYFGVNPSIYRNQAL